MYDKADLIFHDCETGYKSGVHAHYSDLRGLDAHTKNKMWLYHYNVGDKPDCTEDGFLGWVQKHQRFV
jgi:hypothetical protein